MKDYDEYIPGDYEKEVQPPIDRTDKILTWLGAATIGVAGAGMMGKMYYAMNEIPTEESRRRHTEPTVVEKEYSEFLELDMHDPDNLRRLQDVMAKLHPDAEQLKDLSEHYGISVEELTALYEESQADAAVKFTYDDEMTR